MAQENKASGEAEWKINVADGSSKILNPELGPAARFWQRFQGLIGPLILKVWRFLETAYDLGVDDPRKVIHCLKVGVALTVVSLFYYMRPLYEGVGENAMWAIMTVVVVFENTVGATIYKSLNRVFGTTLAGLLAVGVHWLASKSGQKFEPAIVGASVFLLASAATFSRFIPKVKSLFDYGTMIFILTFSLVTVSGYRVDKLFDMAHERISTIVIGTSLSVVVSMLFWPIWAGEELHSQISRNMGKLADSLDCSVAEYFNGELHDSNKDSNRKLLGYKCVLTSKATEESMANFARWEPAHGRFNFKHPWRQYVKIGASMRNCAYCIEALNSCINTETQAPEFIKRQLSDICLRISSNSSIVIRELAETIKTTRKSSNTNSLVEEMSTAAEDLQAALKFPSNLFNPPENGPPGRKNIITPLMDVIPAITLASLLIEVAARIEAIVDEVEELANLAEFKAAADESRAVDKSKQCQSDNRVEPGETKDEEAVKALERV